MNYGECHQIGRASNKEWNLVAPVTEARAHDGGDEQTPIAPAMPRFPQPSQRPQPETCLRSTYRDWRKILDDTPLPDRSAVRRTNAFYAVCKHDGRNAGCTKEHGGLASNIDGIAALDHPDDIQPAATLPHRTLNKSPRSELQSLSARGRACSVKTPAPER